MDETIVVILIIQDLVSNEAPVHPAIDVNVESDFIKRTSYSRIGE